MCWGESKRGERNKKKKHGQYGDHLREKRMGEVEEGKGGDI